MNLDMDGLRVVITAGAGGIGRKTAEAFLSERARVFVCDIDHTALSKFALEQPSIGTFSCDVSDEAKVTEMIKKAVNFLGGIDCLVNNAGSTGPTQPTELVSNEGWNRCIDVNLTGTFNCTRAAIPYLRKSMNPSIISLSSAAGKMGYPKKAPYVAAKWGVVGFTKTISIELGADRIRCNAILPGPVAGARMTGVIADKAKLAGISYSEQEQIYLSKASLKSFIKAEEVADLIVFLSSKKAASISGQAISIDGDLQALS